MYNIHIYFCKKNALKYLKKKVYNNLYIMDIFKKLPFDLQDRIYKEVIYKKKYDGFVKIFENMIEHLAYCDHNIAIEHNYLTIEDAKEDYKDNIMCNYIGCFLDDMIIMDKHHYNPKINKC